MRCLIHDFAGHPFQVQLSRELAARGHDVTHVYPVGLQGPKGRLNSAETDLGNFHIRPVLLAASFRKYSVYRRFAAHRKYARDLKALISRGQFDVVLSGNTPIDVQAEILLHCHRNGVGFIHWVQDVYCRAVEFYLRRRFGACPAAVSFPLRKIEQFVASRSDAAIVIAPAFRDLLLSWGVSRDRVVVLENWAPLDEVRPLPRDNAWSKAHGLTDKTVFLYSGTLGMKHRPDLLYKLALSLGARCKVAVISEGIGRAYLEKLPKLDNLLLLDFQPYEELPAVLGSADVLVATLEADAGEFAVPSKILTYLCAGRPLLLAAPSNNLAAVIVERTGAGFVVAPGNEADWLANAARLLDDSSGRISRGALARSYAECHFDIARIALTFEQVLRQACRSAVAWAQPLPEPQSEL